MKRSLKNKKTKKLASIRYFQGLNYWILASVLVANIFFQLSEVSMSALKYVGIVCSLVPIFFIDKDDYIYAFISYMSVIRVSTIFNIAAINIISIVYFIRTYIFDNKYMRERDKRKFPQNVIVACMVFILYSLQYLLEKEPIIKTPLEIIKLLFFIVFMVDIFRACRTREELCKKFMNIQVYFIAGVLISIVCSLVINPNFALNSERLEVADTSGTNQLGILLAFCIVYSLFAVTRVKNINELLVHGVILFIFTYYCFATQSRTAIVGIMLSLFCIVIWGFSHVRTIIPVATMIATLSLFLYLVFTYGQETALYANIMETVERFTDPKDNDISNGRLDLWKMYIDALMNDAKLFFFGGDSESYPRLVAHNIFIEIWAEYGLIGFGIVCWIYTAVFMEIRNAIIRFGKSKIKVISFLPFAMVFVMGMASHTLIGTVPTVTFCMGTAMIYLYNQDSLDNSNSESDSVAPEEKRIGRYPYRRKLQTIRKF